MAAVQPDASVSSGRRRAGRRPISWSCRSPRATCEGGAGRKGRVCRQRARATRARPRFPGPPRRRARARRRSTVACCWSGSAPTPARRRLAALGARARREAERRGATSRAVVWLGDAVASATRSRGLSRGLPARRLPVRSLQARRRRPRDGAERSRSQRRVPPPAEARATRSRTSRASRTGVFARARPRERAAVGRHAALPRQAAPKRSRARSRGLKVEVWGPSGSSARGLNGLLAVARGSARGAALHQLRYAPPRRASSASRSSARAITFDSGGLSLKPAKSMETMKYDMAGGAAVLRRVAAVGAARPARRGHGVRARHREPARRPARRSPAT